MACLLSGLFTRGPPITPMKKKATPQTIVMLTRQGLSRRWIVSIETLKRKEKAGILRAYKIGRGVRYMLADIERIEAEAEVVR